MLKTAHKNVLASWLGDDAVARTRDIFIEAGIPTYNTPEDATSIGVVEVHRETGGQEYRRQ